MSINSTLIVELKTSLNATSSDKIPGRSWPFHISVHTLPNGFSGSFCTGDVFEIILWSGLLKSYLNVKDRFENALTSSISSRSSPSLSLLLSPLLPFFATGVQGMVQKSMVHYYAHTFKGDWPTCVFFHDNVKS